MKVDKFGFYRTKSGASVRIITTTDEGDHPVLGEVLVRSRWVKMKWTLEGKRHYFGTSSPNDLIEVSDPLRGNPKPKTPEVQLQIKLNSTYKTLHGLKVQIYAIHVNGNLPIHGAVFQNSEWKIMAWTSDGKKNYFGKSSKFDLVEVESIHNPNDSNREATDHAMVKTQNRTG